MVAPELEMWVVYDRPRDFPNSFVARRWLTNKSTDTLIVANDLETIRSALRASGKVAVTRDPHDDPVIVETWL